MELFNPSIILKNGHTIKGVGKNKFRIDTERNGVSNVPTKAWNIQYFAIKKEGLSFQTTPLFCKNIMLFLRNHK